MRVAKALDMRREGRNYEDVAAECGYNSPQAATMAVTRALAKIVTEPAKDVVVMELQRLDVLWGIQYLNAQAGDVGALGACLRIMERRAKLLGLDAPEKRELSAPGGQPLIPPGASITFTDGGPGASSA